ncbi:hypothetical protein BT96DRAFT_918567 [Gymnopus androsaceus JB14]|uniref:RINT-1 family protein n=1 Tax=Gymnopus androsaceus JB14 TaxID=1447944 RepID=A0A6A4HU65_9AGAR|nr:hypothetical protein BT96DRAFT_918567 [Gymnopus androsaceus JB14]
MSSARIQALLAAPDPEQATKSTTLDAEFDESEKAQAELASNLASSSSKVNALIAEAKSSAHSHVETAQNLSLLRHSLTDELVDLTQGLLSSMSSEPGSSTLLEDIETLHRNLNDLQGVKGYAQVVKHVLELSESSIQEIESLPVSSSISTSSVTQFQALQAFVSSVANACSSVEDGAGKQKLHLVGFLERVRDRTWVDIKKRLSTPLLDAAEQLHWPMSVDYGKARQDERTAFEHAFIRLLQLQRVVSNASSSESRSEKDGIYPLEILIQPVALRFKYHFEGQDKPEWYFTHVLNVAHDHRPFMDHVVQHLLKSAGHNSVNAWCRHYYHIRSLLAHTIYQALSFDTALKEEGFELDGTLGCSKGDSAEPWTGISDVILGRKEWFDAWLDGEKRFAENQYHDIIGASDAWQIADDEPDHDDTVSSSPDIKTTNSARRVKALIEQVTDRYSPLQASHTVPASCSLHKYLFWCYTLGRITSSLDAYETLASSLVRAVPGALGVSLGVKDDHSSSINVDTNRFTSGVEGVQRLCKALLSSRFVEAAMHTWGEDLFFLELWTEINQRPALQALARASSVLPVSTLIAKYQKVGSRSEDIIVQQVCAEIESNLKGHLSTTTTSPNPGTMSKPDDDFTLSQTLLAPIALLSTHLSYMRVTLPQQILTPLYRRIASRLAEHLLQRQILYRGHFTSTEGRAIHGECELWVETCRVTLLQAFGGSRNRVEAPWLRLVEAARLVSVEGEPRERVVNATFGGTDEGEWEEVMVEVVGCSELTREEVGRILRRID